jgi:low temperature requirement protein LtrA
MLGHHSGPSISLPQFLLPLAIILPLIAFWLWMFRDMLNNRYLLDNERNTWTVLFIFLNVFAALLYYVNVYRNRS